MNCSAISVTLQHITTIMPGNQNDSNEVHFRTTITRDIQGAAKNVPTRKMKLRSNT